MFLNIQVDLLILKTYYGQFTLTTNKSSHIIFKERVLPARRYGSAHLLSIRQGGRAHDGALELEYAVLLSTTLVIVEI